MYNVTLDELYKKQISLVTVALKLQISIFLC